MPLKDEDCKLPIDQSLLQSIKYINATTELYAKCIDELKKKLQLAKAELLEVALIMDETKSECADHTDCDFVSISFHRYIL